MRTDPRRALAAWVVLVIAAAGVGARVDATLAVRIAFLLVPAGFLAALAATAIRHYVGEPAVPDGT